MPHEEYLFHHVDNLQPGNSPQTEFNALSEMLYQISQGASWELSEPFLAGYAPGILSIRVTYISPEPDPEDYDDGCG